MKIKIDGEYYSLTQCLMAVWVYLDEWRKYLKAIPKKEKMEKIGNVAFWTVIGAIGMIEFYILSMILIVLH